MNEEVWRDVVDFPEYAISNYGNVIHKERPDTLRKITLNANGFPTIVLFKREHPGSRYLRQINTLVARAFIGPPPPKKLAVWHIDGNLQNCHETNLIWEMRARVLEWNEMHRTNEPRYRTPKVIHNSSGKVYLNAFECAMAIGDTETSVVTHIEKYPPQYADRARYRYIT